MAGPSVAGRDVDFTSLGLSWNGGPRHDDERHSAANYHRGRARDCLFGTEEGAQGQTETQFPQEKALEFGGLADWPRDGCHDRCSRIWKYTAPPKPRLAATSDRRWG